MSTHIPNCYTSLYLPNPKNMSLTRFAECRMLKNPTKYDVAISCRIIYTIQVIFYLALFRRYLPLLRFLLISFRLRPALPDQLFMLRRQRRRCLQRLRQLSVTFA